MIQSDLVVLSPEESHHLARVLRVEPGQELTLFDGEGARAAGVVKSAEKKTVAVRITSRETVPPPEVEITLIQAVCKPDRFDMILQKATELGVRTIQPVLTANAGLPAAKIEKRIARGEAIIRNAAQQCGSAWLPVFHRLRRISELFPTPGKNRPAPTQLVPDPGTCRAGTAEGLPAAAGRSATIPALQNFDAVFIGSLHPNAKPFREAFAALDRSALKSAALLIGPEGDFTAEEVHTAVAAGAIPVSFGERILRTETAAIFGLSVLAYELF